MLRVLLTELLLLLLDERGHGLKLVWSDLGLGLGFGCERALCLFRPRNVTLVRITFALI